MSAICKYGDIIAVNIAGESKGQQQHFVRHAVVVSADIINENLPTVIVCPLIEAEQVKRSRIGATYIPKEETGLDFDCVVFSLQVKTIYKDQIVQRVGTLSFQYQLQLKESLQAVLELEEYT